MKDKKNIYLYKVVGVIHILLCILAVFIYFNEVRLSLVLFLLHIAFLVFFGFLYYELQHTYQILSKSTKDAVRQEKMLKMHEVVLELSNYMIKTNSLDELLDITLKKIIETIPEAEYGSILLMNDDRKLEYRAVYGYDRALLKVTLNPKDSYQWRATNGNFTGPLILHDLSELSKEVVVGNNYEILKEKGALHTKSAMSAPLLLEGQFFGSINIDSIKKNVFKNEDLKLMAYFANQVTIAIQNHLYYEKIIFNSKHDDLTGAMNRRYFQEYMKTYFEESNEEYEVEKGLFTLVIMDLDNFKGINDQYGHVAGDNILAHFANSFMTYLSMADIFVRYGGDEFIAVFFDSNKADTEEKLKDIYHHITKAPIHLSTENLQINCRFSYGLAAYPLEGDKLKDLIHLADQRMYLQKRIGWGQA